MSTTNLFHHEALNEDAMQHQDLDLQEERTMSAHSNNYGTIISSHHSTENSECNSSNEEYRPDFSTTITKLKYGGRTSTAGATFIMLNALIGSAFLNLPYATKVFNLEMLLFGQLPIVLISILVLIFLATAIEMTQKIALQDIIQVLFGSKLKVIIDIALLCYTFATCVGYMMVVEDQSVLLIQWFVNTEELPAANLELWDKAIAALSCLIMVYPLCIPRSVNFLYYPSVASFFVNLYVVVFVIVRYFTMEEQTRPRNITEPAWSMEAFVGFVAVVIFEFQGFFTAPAIYSDLKRRTPTNWLIVCSLSNFGSLIVYTALAAFVLMTFGTAVDEDFLNTYETNDPLAITARLCIMTSVIASYPIICFVACKVIQDYLFAPDKLQTGPLSFGKYFTLKTSFFFLTLLCMLFAPGMSQVFILSGILASFSTLALPGMVMIRIRKEYGRAEVFVMILGWIFIVTNIVFVAGYLYTKTPLKLIWS